ncbi:DUF5518 domain-containing protein [Halorubrum halodurans]|uniref:DUF5518 domain-containing protein n=1 Tax=Halorubrum halodurans TaxID=1383851 RepID=A0A256IJG7_9EURY|nr:DUF5518 domain-containing protein [Halorubrum halodurans]OYR56436.1 hypothetical protein DJ70_09010 [Halorubrum halodurans]
MNTENTLLNAVAGAVATIALSFTGISPVLGGALAGYLDGGDTGDGLRVGALSGAIASVPVAGFLLLVLLVLPFLGFFGFPLEVGLAAGGVAVLAVVIVVGGIAYTVALSALGGFLGVYLADEL